MLNLQAKTKLETTEINCEPDHKNPQIVQNKLNSAYQGTLLETGDYSQKTNNTGSFLSLNVVLWNPSTSILLCFWMQNAYERPRHLRALTGQQLFHPTGSSSLTTTQPSVLHRTLLHTYNIVSIVLHSTLVSPQQKQKNWCD